MPWIVNFSDRGLKELGRLPPHVQPRIMNYLDERIVPADNPRALGEALQGVRYAGLWRYRVGDYRIICRIEDHRLIVVVVSVGHRREVYR